MSEFGLISPAICSFRKLRAFRTVSQRRTGKGWNSALDVIQRIHEVHDQGMKGSILEKVIALWTMEGLGVTLGRRFGTASVWTITDIRKECRAIVAVGMGAGVVAAEGFNPKWIFRRSGQKTADEMKSMPYFFEGVGHMIAAQDYGLTRKLLGMPTVVCLSEARFLSSFSPETQARIELGWGRFVYLASWNMTTAIDRIRNRFPGNHFENLKGAAFAYTMINMAAKLKADDWEGKFCPRLGDHEAEQAFILGAASACDFLGKTFIVEGGPVAPMRPAAA